MREYSYHATEETVETLRLLRQPWSGFIATDTALTVQVAEGTTVRVEVERSEVEPGFEAFRLTAARVEGMSALFAELGEHAPDFAAGRNDIVVFHGETWLERPDATVPDLIGPDASIQFTGRAGQRTATAEAVCLTTDAVVVATPRGSGLLARIGVRPFSLQVTEEREEIARFLMERGYSG